MATFQRKAQLSVLILAAVLFGALAGSGCAVRRGDRSTVRPLALDKKQFQGEWYYLTTVIDSPYDAPGIFPGNSSDMTKIRWEITERYLFAFTTRPQVLNADSTSAPIAAWPIESHFTVRYQINYATGEPSNVISEDMIDKPWYQRPHFRVIWGRSVISDYTTSFWFYQYFGYVRKEMMATNIRPHEVRIKPDYMDFVAEEVLTPGIGALIGKLNVGMPVTDYRIRIRHSFRKAGKSTYTSRPMSDDNFQKFGYFRTARIVYNMNRGLVDWSYQYLANRHNVANAAEIKAGSKKPKQIVYYLSPNFPEGMKSTANLIADDWNKAFQRALNRPGEKIFVVKDNADGLPKGQKRRMGDLRYNYLYWVSKPLSFGLLGYGPSHADYDTGEIVSASAYVYGPVVQRVTERFMLYYNMVKGRYTDEDLRNGKDYLDTVNNFFTTPGTQLGTKSSPLTSYKGAPIMAPQYKGFNLNKAHRYVQSTMFRARSQKLQTLDRSRIAARFKMIDKNPSLKWKMMSDEMLRSHFPRTDIAEIRKIADDDAKKVLDSYLNPANLIRADGLRTVMKDTSFFSKRTMLRENYVDPALSKFVKANKDKSESELRMLMARMIFRGTEAHEVGHTLGLRHNFEGSADKDNYFKEYYQLQNNQGGNIPGVNPDKRHPWFYMYSSIMDYHGDVYGDGVGIGKYDHAAIMYAYGNLLELKEEDKSQHLSDLQDYLGNIEIAAKKTAGDDGIYKGIFTKIEVTKNNFKTFDGKDYDGKKITLFKTDQVLMEIKGVDAKGEKRTIMRLTADDLSGRSIVKDIWALFKVNPKGIQTFRDGRPFLDQTVPPLKRHFYRFCSDELVGQNPYCNRFDSGSNPKQIVDNMIRRYDGTYPLRNWARGRRYYRLSYGYLSYLISQFSVISNFYQNWMWRVVNQNDYTGSKEYFDQLAAVQRGVAFINRVIHTPEPGRHIYDANAKAYTHSAQSSSDDLQINVGVGRYFYSKLMDDELGLAQYRFARIGTMYDKYVAMMALVVRDWGLAQNRLDFFFVNFSDFFSEDDVHEMFIGGISGIFNKNFSLTYKDRMIEPSWHPILQYQSMYMGLSMLNSALFGNTFGHYMTVGVQGAGSGWTPPDGATTVQFTNTAGTRTYFAVQTTDGKSIAWKLVERGKALSDRLKQLRAANTTAINRAELERVQADLRWVETVINSMRLYVGIFYDGN